MKAPQTRQIFGVLIIVFALVIFYTDTRPATSENTAQVQTRNGTVSVTIEGLYQNKSVSISAGESILSILRALDTQNPKMQLKTKEYKGLGTLVEGMHGMQNGTDKKYWQYTVRGVEPQIGADAYIPKNGDSVEWSFATSKE